MGADAPIHLVALVLSPLLMILPWGTCHLCIFARIRLLSYVRFKLSGVPRVCCFRISYSYVAIARSAIEPFLWQKESILFLISVAKERHLVMVVMLRFGFICFGLKPLFSMSLFPCLLFLRPCRKKKGALVFPPSVVTYTSRGSYQVSPKPRSVSRRPFAWSL